MNHQINTKNFYDIIIRLAAVTPDCCMEPADNLPFCKYYFMGIYICCSPDALAQDFFIGHGWQTETRICDNRFSGSDSYNCARMAVPRFDYWRGYGDEEKFQWRYINYSST